MYNNTNLLKAGWIPQPEQPPETLVIDNNERVAKRLADLHVANAQTEGFVSAREGAFAVVDPEDAESVLGEGAEGAPEGLDALLAEGGAESGGVPAPKEPVYEGPTPEELVAQAKEEVEQIRQSALEEAERRKQEGYEEGRQTGYQEGYEEGMAKVRELEAELAQKEEQLQQQYLDKMKELEPQFVDTLNRIYERVFDVKFSEQRGLILHLLSSAMRGIDETKDFILHVSPQDYQEVRDARAMLTSESLVGSATVEIIEDMTLQKNECFIETGGGIFDCSLGVELQQLQKELALLAYEK